MRGDVTKTKPCALGAWSARAERASCSARRSGRTPYIRRPRTRRGAPCAVSVLRVSLVVVVVVGQRRLHLPWSKDAVHIQGLAQPGRGMGEDGRGLGKEEDPRMRQQQNPLASPTVRHCPSTPSRSLPPFVCWFISLFLTFLSVALVLCSCRDSVRRTAVTLAFTSIRLDSFVYMRAPSVLAVSPIPFRFTKTRRDAFGYGVVIRYQRSPRIPMVHFDRESNSSSL